MQASVKKLEGYKIYMNKLLGAGNYGSVYEGVCDQTGQKVAIKALKKSKIDSDPYLKSAFLSEIKIMNTVSSENIVKLQDVLQSPNNYYIVQELCPQGNLEQVIKYRKQRNEKFTEKQAKNMLRQMANGFLALVKEGIIHRDFKPANVMIKDNALKIGDFGFAKKSLNPGSITDQTICGTPLYMPLELLKTQPYSSKCDVWALAFIFYQLLHLKTPWTGKSEYNLVENIQNEDLKIDDSLSETTKDFLRKCLEKKQSNRLCWDQVFVHPIFEKYFENKALINKKFEDKMKTIMSQLRFQVNANNLDTLKILKALGYNLKEKEITKAEFIEFLKVVNPVITTDQAEYIFTKTDLDKNGLISISQIQNLFGSHQISLTSIYKKVPTKMPHKTLSLTTEQNFDEEKCLKKIQLLFKKLFIELQKQNKLLFDIFLQFNTSRNGIMSRDEFSKMINKMTNNYLCQQETAYLFMVIDTSRTNFIRFQDLNSFFSKINEIPPHLNRPQSMNYNMYPQYMPAPMGFYGNILDYSYNMYQQPMPNSYLPPPSNPPPNYIYGIPVGFNQPQRNSQKKIQEIQKLAMSSKGKNKKN